MQVTQERVASAVPAVEPMASPAAVAWELTGAPAEHSRLRNPIPVEAKWPVAHQKEFSAGWMKVGPTLVHCAPQNIF